MNQITPEQAQQLARQAMEQNTQYLVNEFEADQKASAARAIKSGESYMVLQDQYDPKTGRPLPPASRPIDIEAMGKQSASLREIADKMDAAVTTIKATAIDVAKVEAPAS